VASKRKAELSCQPVARRLSRSRSIILWSRGGGNIKHNVVLPSLSNQEAQKSTYGKLTGVGRSQGRKSGINKLNKYSRQAGSISNQRWYGKRPRSPSTKKVNNSFRDIVSEEYYT
jgi:hypothetical protein